MNRTLVFAAALMSAGVSLIPLGDAAGKAMVSSGISPIFVAWSRLSLGALILLPFIERHALRAVLTDWRVWLRSGCQIGTLCAILTALRTEPLATVFGAFFVGPLLSYGLSVWLLGERVTWARSFLLLLGFLGVLLVVKPGFGVTPGILWAAGAGLFYGCFLTASRWLSGTARPKVLMVSQLVIGGLVLAPFGAMSLPDPNAALAGWLAISVLASLAGNLLMIQAYRAAPATLMAPFIYVQLLSASILGWLVFGNWPDTVAMIGLLLIFGSGLATFALRPAAG